MLPRIASEPLEIFHTEGTPEVEPVAGISLSTGLLFVLASRILQRGWLACLLLLLSFKMSMSLLYSWVDRRLFARYELHAALHRLGCVMFQDPFYKYGRDRAQDTQLHLTLGFQGPGYAQPFPQGVVARCKEIYQALSKPSYERMAALHDWMEEVKQRVSPARFRQLYCSLMERGYMVTASRLHHARALRPRI